MNAIVEDIQNIKLELARKFAEELVGDYDTARLILTLANQAGALAAERDGLKAARYAYATEFLLNEEGQPDVGSIHQNIRALKADHAKVMKAAKMALDAMNRGYMGRNHSSYCAAIEALQQLGMQ